MVTRVVSFPQSRAELTPPGGAAAFSLTRALAHSHAHTLSAVTRCAPVRVRAHACVSVRVAILPARRAAACVCCVGWTRLLSAATLLTFAR